MREALGLSTGALGAVADPSGTPAAATSRRLSPGHYSALSAPSAAQAGGRGRDRALARQRAGSLERRDRESAGEPNRSLQGARRRDTAGGFEDHQSSLVRCTPDVEDT